MGERIGGWDGERTGNKSSSSKDASPSLFSPVVQSLGKKERKKERRRKPKRTCQTTFFSPPPPPLSHSSPLSFLLLPPSTVALESGDVPPSHTWARGGGWWGDTPMHVVKPYVVTYAVFKLHHPPSSSKNDRCSPMCAPSTS